MDVATGVATAKSDGGLGVVAARALAFGGADRDRRDRGWEFKELASALHAQR